MVYDILWKSLNNKFIIGWCRTRIESLNEINCNFNLRRINNNAKIITKMWNTSTFLNIGH